MKDIKIQLEQDNDKCNVTTEEILRWVGEKMDGFSKLNKIRKGRIIYILWIGYPLIEILPIINFKDVFS